MFICDDCEHKNLALSETHTKMHTVIRITEKEEKRSMEERLQFLEDEMVKVRQSLVDMEQTLRRLVDKSGGWSRRLLEDW